jgi:hypothetical protein
MKKLVSFHNRIFKLSYFVPISHLAHRESKRFEEFIEGKPNVLSTKENFHCNFQKGLAQDEFFSELV